MPNPSETTTDSSAGASANASAKKFKLTKILPTDRLTLDRQLAALRAFAAVSDSNPGNPVSNEAAGEIVQPKKMAADTIVMTNAFFCDVGLLVRQDDGAFLVAPEVLAFFKAEHGLAPESAPEKLRPLFEKQWFTQLITPRLKLGPQDLDGVVYKVLGEACGAGRDHLERLQRLVEFICYVGLATRDGNQIRLGALATPSAPPAATGNQGATSGGTGTPTKRSEDSEDGLERHSLTLDAASKKRVVIYAPASISKPELDRIQKWLSFQLIVSD